jgi:hypothetical protein
MKVIIIGGSAGSFNVIASILKGLKEVKIPIVIILHRKSAKTILEEYHSRIIQ